MKARSTQEKKAYEIMAGPVVTVGIKDSIFSVARLFSDKNIGAAAVLDQEGKPVGVITKTDLVHYEKDRDEIKTVHKKDAARLKEVSRQSDASVLGAGYHEVETEDTVEHWMTPVIFSVKPDTSLSELAQRMVKYGIHHIFVREPNTIPILGIITSFDVLRLVAAQEVGNHARRY